MSQTVCTATAEGHISVQVQALAQSTIQDLHSKLAAKSAEVEDGRRRLQASRSQAAEEAAHLQDQVEQLSHQLQLQDQRHVKVPLNQSRYGQPLSNQPSSQLSNTQAHNPSTSLFIHPECADMRASPSLNLSCKLGQPRRKPYLNKMARHCWAGLVRWATSQRCFGSLAIFAGHF